MPEVWTAAVVELDCRGGLGGLGSVVVASGTGEQA